MPRCLRTVVGTTLCLLVLSVAGRAQQEQFAQANKFYEDRDPGSAIRLYEAILARGEESAELYFNLGNAYFKQGDLGHAIVNYLRAKRLAPGDDDIRHNLAFAKQFSTVQMEGVALNPVHSFMISLVDSYRLNALAWMASAVFVLFVLVLLVRFGLAINTSVVRVATAVLAVVLVAAVGLTTFKYRHEYLTPRAVIVAEECPVMTGPSEQADVELQGAPGLVVEILAEDAGFVEVQFENNRRGWVMRDLIATL